MTDLNSKHCKKMKLDLEVKDLKKATSLTDLPDLPILKIASYLSLHDFLSLTHTCRSLFRAFEREERWWIDLLKRDNIALCKEIRRIADSIFDTQNLFETKNVSKLTFFLHKRTQKNWTEGHFAKLPSVRYRKQVFDRLINKSVDFVATVDYDEDADCWLFEFNLWSARFSKFKTFNHRIFKAEENLDMEVGRFFINDQLIILQFDKFAEDTLVQENVYLKIEFSVGQLHEVARFICSYPGAFANRSTLFSHYLINCMMRPHEEGFVIEGFNLIDGSKDFSQIIETALCYSTTTTADDDWVIFVTTKSEEDNYQDCTYLLHAINTKTNTHKQLPMFGDGREYIEDMILKKGKLLCFYRVGSVVIIDLNTLSVLSTTKLFKTVRWQQKVWLDFDPDTLVIDVISVTDKVKCELSTISGNRRDSVKFASLSSEITSEAVKVLNNLVMVHYTANSRRLFSNISISRCRSLKEHRLQINCNDRMVTINKITPLYITLEVNSKLYILDFFIRSQYLEAN